MAKRGTSGDSSKNWLGIWTAAAIVVLLAAFAGVIRFSSPQVSGDRLNANTFFQYAEDGRLHNAEILDADGIVVGTYERDDGTEARYHMRYFASSVLRERLAETLLDNEIPFEVDQQFLKTLVLPATLLLPALIFVVIFIYLILSYRQGTGLFAITSGAQKVDSQDGSEVTFDDVAGQDAAITEVREIAQFLSDPQRFAAVGARVPKGVLLYGPPGCGKTLMARALAGEAGASFYSISGSDFVELYVGVGASRVRDLFREARENAPAIVFIDELDAIGRRRKSGGSGGGSQEEHDQALNQILTQMDGFTATEGVIIIGASNRPDVLDPALLRPGRFDRTIGLERPDEAGRLAILRVHAEDKALAAGVDLARIANKAVGLNGADLANLMNEGALLAARSGKQVVEQADLEAALQRILEAPERQRRLSLRDRDVGHRYTSDEDRVTFDDVGGLEEAIEELVEIKDYLANPGRYAQMGARIPRGVLLDGPPGCGKTLMARALAGEANAAFLYAEATEFVEVYVGEGAARVRDFFAEAKSLAPAIVFIDEIDAVGARRGSGPGSHRERENTLNQILTELDGFNARDGVIVIAATNRADILDPALVRAGRFDRNISVSLPHRERRREILEVHAEGKPLGDDVDLDVIARLTHGFSGADLANVLNEAVLLAARRGLSQVSMALIDEAMERSVLGIAPGGRTMSDRERSMVAYHEAGHALVGRALDGASTPHRLTIIPRGPSLGATWNVDGDDRSVHSRTSLVERMAGILGGRAAEELVFEEASSGAADDLQRVNRIARKMVVEFGMSPDLGQLTFEGGGPDGRPVTYSGDMIRRVDTEVGKLTDEAYELARKTLAGRRELLDEVAATLLERETLTAAEFAGLVDDR